MKNAAHTKNKPYLSSEIRFVFLNKAANYIYIPAPTALLHFTLHTSHFTLMKRFEGAFFDAFKAEDALGAVFSAAAVVVDLHIHGADALAFAAVYTFALVAFHAEEGEVAHGF